MKTRRVVPPRKPRLSLDEIQAIHEARREVAARVPSLEEKGLAIYNEVKAELATLNLRVDTLEKQVNANRSV